jgi:hypothetical protein
MSTFLIDLVGGNNANNGTTRAQAWKDFTNGATAARIAPGDTIKIKKTPDPTSIGAAQWTNTTKAAGGLDTAVNITSSTNATPIEITKNSHGLANGDVVWIKSHTTNTNANGVWIIANVATNTFTLTGSVGNGVGGASGTYQRVTNACVVMGTAVNKTITNCETAWTAVGSGCATILTTSGTRQHANAVQITTDASVTTARQLAKFGLPASLDLSGYRQLSFWIQMAVGTPAAGDMVIKLYSDSACTTEVESLSIPAISVTGKNTPIVIDKGSALSATVQGIAINCTVSFASKWIYIDNIIACKDSTAADSLTHKSLIGKTSAAQGGEWFAIQSIDEKIIVLDVDPASAPFTHRGYVGTTESVTTYKRDVFDTVLASSTSTVVNEIMDSGTSGSNIVFSGGWDWTDDSGGTQNGETFLSGSNGNGYGLQLSSKNFITLDRINFSRYYTGLFTSSSHNLTISIGNVTNCTSNCVSTSACNSLLTFGYIRDSVASAVFTTNSIWSTFIITQVSNGANYGFAFNGAFNCIAKIGAVKNNGSGGINYANGGCFITLVGTTLAMNTTSLNGAPFASYEYNCVMLDTTEFSMSSSSANPKHYSQNHDQGGYDYIASDSAYAVSVDDGASGKKWVIYPTAAARDVLYPFDLLIARRPIAASGAVTVTLKFNKSHATNIGAKLVVKGAIVGGVEAEQSATAANSTGDQIVTLTFTPSAASVIEVFAYGYYVAGAANVTVDQSGTTAIISQA